MFQGKFNFALQRKPPPRHRQCYYCVNMKPLFLIALSPSSLVPEWHHSLMPLNCVSFSLLSLLVFLFLCWRGDNAFPEHLSNFAATSTVTNVECLSFFLLPGSPIPARGCLFILGYQCNLGEYASLLPCMSGLLHLVDGQGIMYLVHMAVGDCHRWEGTQQPLYSCFVLLVWI